MSRKRPPPVPPDEHAEVLTKVIRDRAKLYLKSKGLVPVEKYMRAPYCRRPQGRWRQAAGCNIAGDDRYQRELVLRHLPGHKHSKRFTADTYAKHIAKHIEGFKQNRASDRLLEVPIEQALEAVVGTMRVLGISQLEIDVGDPEGGVRQTLHYPKKSGERDQKVEAR